MLRVITHAQLDGLLGLAEATLAIGHERQVIQVAVHAECCLEFAQCKLVVTLTIRNHGERFAGDVDTGRLLSGPLRMGQGAVGIVSLKV